MVNTAANVLIGEEHIHGLFTLSLKSNFRRFIKIAPLTDFIYHVHAAYKARGCGTLFNGLYGVYGEALPERGTFSGFRFMKG